MVQSALHGRPRRSQAAARPPLPDFTQNVPSHAMWAELGMGLFLHMDCPSKKALEKACFQLPRVRRGASRLKTERGREPSVNSRMADSRLECQAWAAMAGLAASGWQGHGPRGSAGCTLPTAAPHVPSSYVHSLGKAERLGSANAAGRPWTRLRILSPAKEAGIEERCTAPVPVFAGRLTLGPRGRGRASPVSRTVSQRWGGCVLPLAPLEWPLSL